MQFSCESCKATLHIGDEKVKGKRLVVRCKKCGARIQIADPALGPPPAGAAPLSVAPAPIKAASALASAPPPKRAELQPAPARERDPGDTESTQAMDSGVLEQALRASKIDDSTLGDGLPQLSGAKLNRAPPPPPPAPEPLRDPPIWFAMVSGKQTGPLSRAELGLKIAQGQITARTYLWKESMAGWQRAQEVTELAALLGPPPTKPPPSTNTIPPPVPAARAPSARDSASPFGDLQTGEHAPLSLDERRGRQRVQPDFAKPELAFELDDRAMSSSGIELPLELEAARTPAQKVQTNKSSPGTLRPEPAAALFAPEREVVRDPLSPAEEADDDDRTHVEPLPLGERVHQEAVANELFSSSGESSAVGASAKDLASWASQELGRRPPTAPNIPKAPVPTGNLPRAGNVSPISEGAASGAAAKAPVDPLANVPNAPGFSVPDPVDTTGNIIARSGAKQKRTGTLVLLIGGFVLALAALLYSLSSNDRPLAAPQSEQTQKQALGGTGESVSGLVQGTTSGLVAAPPPDAVKPPAPSKKVAAAPPAADKAKADEAAQNAQALAQLDNERGIGNHGPKADAVATPDTTKTEVSLSAEDIKKKLGENKGALQSCIDEALRKEPNLRVGKIHIATTIAPSGVVTSAKIDKKPVDDSPLGACLKRATRRIVFPAFQGDEFEVDIPILVTAGD